MAYITVKDMKEYLNRFSDDDNISFVVINSKERLHYIPKELTLIGDMAAIFMDTTESESFDEE